MKSSPPKLKLARPLGVEPPTVTEDASPEALVARLDQAKDWTDQAPAKNAGTALTAPVFSAEGQGAPVQSAEKVWPWAGTDNRIKKGYSMRIPEPMLAKLEFLKQNEPNVSVHRLILLGIERELDARLPRHGWTGPNRHL